MKISVVTPSFNQGQFLERTIQSVLMQNSGTFTYEYTVIDGASSDQTISILKKYESNLKWVSEPDHGQAHAVNKGLMQVSGEIIGWLNSDDVYYPSTLKTVSDFFKNNPDIDVLYGDAYLINSEDQIIGLYPTEPFSSSRLKQRCFLSQPATFFRARVLNQYGLLDESLQYCMDYEYWLRLALKQAKFCYLHQVLAATRIYAETKSSRACVQASREAIQVVREKLGVVPASWLVSYAGASVKTHSNVSYPSVAFVIFTWLKLWQVTNTEYRFFSRVFIWVSAQKAMIKEFFRRRSALKKMKKRYRWGGV